MAWWQTGDNSLLKTMITQCNNTYAWISRPQWINIYVCTQNKNCRERKLMRSDEKHCERHTNAAWITACQYQHSTPHRYIDKIFWTMNCRKTIMIQNKSRYSNVTFNTMHTNINKTFWAMMLLCDLVAIDPCRLIIFIFDTFQMQDNSSINATWHLTKVWDTQYITVHPTNNVGGSCFDAFHCGWVPVITIVDVDSYIYIYP